MYRFRSKLVYFVKDVFVINNIRHLFLSKYVHLPYITDPLCFIAQAPDRMTLAFGKCLDIGQVVSDCTCLFIYQFRIKYILDFQLKFNVKSPIATNLLDPFLREIFLLNLRRNLSPNNNDSHLYWP
jgi:hypothetical protein